MEILPNSFIDRLSTLVDEDLSPELIDGVAELFDVQLDGQQLATWVDKLADRLCAVFGFDTLEFQPDLFETWEQRLAEIPEKFLSSFSSSELDWIQEQRGNSWVLPLLVSKLDQLEKIKFVPEPFDVLASSRRRPRTTTVSTSMSQQQLPGDPDPAAIAAPARSRAGRLTGLALLEALPQWAALLPAARFVFTVMYRRAHRSASAAQPWCQVSVGLLMKATGYGNTQVRNSLAQLRRGRWIGYVVRGRPQIGGSRYWVATSPAQLGPAAVLALAQKFGFKP